MHKVEIPTWAVERALARRGRLQPFHGLDSARTALVLVDLQNGFMAPGQPAEMAQAREIVTCSGPNTAASSDAASTPFCKTTTNDSGPTAGCIVRAASATCQAFTPTSTTPTPATSAGSSVAWAGEIRISSDGVSTRRPLARIARRCSPLATKTTSSPARANCASKYPPAPPVPNTMIRTAAP